MNEKYERNGSRSFFIFLAGSLIGAGIAMLYAPMTGEETRQYLILQSERGKRQALDLTGDFKERISYLISEIREAADKAMNEGLQLTREKKKELFTAIEAGRKAMEEEKKRLEQLRLGEKNPLYADVSYQEGLIHHAQPQGRYNYFCS
jgi:gas vesicle protein